MATAPTLKHQKPALTHAVLETNIRGVSVSTAVTVTSKSTTIAPFVLTTKPYSSGFIVQTQTYSYDGIIHIESYVSDI